MNTYRATGKIAAAVCEHLGWRAEVNPIKAFRRGDVVYATGTLLHPGEWRTLRSHDGETMLDGAVLRVTGIPRGV